eukprot:714391-Lingulodinium_polyedra.AAC.1
MIFSCHIDAGDPAKSSKFAPPVHAHPLPHVARLPHDVVGRLAPAPLAPTPPPPALSRVSRSISTWKP